MTNEKPKAGKDYLEAALASKETDRKIAAFIGKHGEQYPVAEAETTSTGIPIENVPKTSALFYLMKNGSKKGPKSELDRALEEQRVAEGVMY